MTWTCFFGLHQWEVVGRTTITMIRTWDGVKLQGSETSVPVKIEHCSCCSKKRARAIRAVGHDIEVNIDWIEDLGYTKVKDVEREMGGKS